MKNFKSLVKANFLKSADIYPFFSPIEKTQGTVVSVRGSDLVMVSSNDYLGLTHHPYVKERAIRAIKKYGTACTGSRILNGNLVIHEELEVRLADYLGYESCLVFATGMQANLGALSSLCGPKDCMLCDSENHASIIDSSRLAMGTTFKYKHNNLESLEKLLSENINRFKNVIIVADGVFSMTGELLLLPGIVALAKKYGAVIYIDDAHGIGVMGDRGRGTANHFGLTDKIDFCMGTFSKSFSSTGGFVVGERDFVDYIRHDARAFLFSAAMAPSAVETVASCLDIILRDDTLFPRLWSNVNMIRKGFEEIGFYTYNSQTPVIPIFVGDEIKALKIVKFLEQRGVFATPVLPPAVPKGEALIRTSYMATHTREQLTKVLEVLAEAKKELAIPGAAC